MPKKLTNEDFLIKASNNFIYLENYINSTTHIDVKCKKCNHIFPQTPKNNFKGRGCPKCNNENKFKNNSELVIELNDIHHNKYGYDKTIITKLKDEKITIFCKKCNQYFEQLYEVHKNGNGCQKCNGGVKYTQSDFIKKITPLHPTLDFTNSVYVKSDSNIEVSCKICSHTFHKQPNKLQQGQGCPKCRISKGEKKVEDYLTNNNINYITQYKFDECKYKRHLPFDFYLPKYNTCIEYDGEQHYTAFNFENDNSKLKTRQKRDKIKTDFCLKNKIKLIRIPFYHKDEIDTILNEKINI